MIPHKKKIGEILIENALITKDMLDEALSHQKKYGGNITQYLISSGKIDENKLAMCISTQFGCPYLPLWAYDIAPEIIALIPFNAAEKYWLVPLDKIGNIITIVMADPFDEGAIGEVERITGCKVQPFVGILSDIIKAIERYYNAKISGSGLKKTKGTAPLFIDTKGYAGVERRRSVRINAKISVHFPIQDEYKRTKTKNVSMHGLLFESRSAFPIDAYIILDIELPKEVNPYPIAAIAQVKRVIPIGEKGYDIGVELVKIPKDDLDKIMRYAMSIAEG